MRIRPIRDGGCRKNDVGVPANLRLDLRRQRMRTLLHPSTPVDSEYPASDQLQASVSAKITIAYVVRLNGAPLRRGVNID